MADSPGATSASSGQSVAGVSTATSRPKASAPTAPRQRWGILLLCGLAMALFIGLGVWQVQRLHWKTALIARVNARVNAAPQALPTPAEWSRLSPDAVEYRHVQFSGHWDKPLLWIHAGSSAGWGYWVMRPLQTDSTLPGQAQHIWVNLGFVQEAQRKLLATALENAPTRLEAGTGLLRISEKEPLLRHNQPTEGLWYSRDVAAMTAASHLDSHSTAPWFIDAQTLRPATEGPATEGPVMGLTVIHFNNNHLAYAITWFALAALSGVAGWIALKHPRAHAFSEDRQARTSPH